MLLITGIPRYTQSNSYMLSLTECVWEFRINALCSLLVFRGRLKSNWTSTDRVFGLTAVTESIINCSCRNPKVKTIRTNDQNIYRFGGLVPGMFVGLYFAFQNQTMQLRAERQWRLMQKLSFGHNQQRKNNSLFAALNRIKALAHYN